MDCTRADALAPSPADGDPGTFRAHETARADELDGVRLATFGQRALGIGIDFAIVSVIRAVVGAVWQHAVPYGWEGYTRIDVGDLLSAFAFFAYFTIAVYVGRGRTPGKWAARTAVVSLRSNRPTLWQSFERSLGYGASVVVAGLGFLQFFRNRNRQCAHDRLAETIVVDLRVSSRGKERSSAACSSPA